ncbi:phage holin family protein, partial [Kitasatospora sp. NPDC085879]|uniref:phage holin family protein n=1 Tax=Kitasatospora sp. NPDC085879 TaxID=3154769 RepID=UPI003446DED7
RTDRGAPGRSTAAAGRGPARRSARRCNGRRRGPPRRRPVPLIGEITSDLGQLVRDEIDLAKAEITQEASKAGKASGMLAGAGYAGHLVLVLASLTVVFALGNVMNLAWAALIVTVVWAVTGAVLYRAGR